MNKIFDEDPHQEIERVRLQNVQLTEKLVQIHSAYFDFTEYGIEKADALERAIIDSMDEDMIIILELALKRGENRRRLSKS